MKKIKNFLGKYWIYIAAFVLPWLLIIVYGLLADSWPMGSGSMITGDTGEQLVPFAYQLWDKVHSGDSKLYTWNIGGGMPYGTMLGYLYSPFSLLLWCVPRAAVPNTMQFIMVMKWALAGVAMTYFFYHTRHNKMHEYKQLVSFFLGMAYVLSNSVLCYMKYIQFGDVTICFPILLLLTERIVTDKRWRLYYVVLTAIIVMNTYLAYEVCLFLFLWFVMQLDSTVEEKAKKFFLFAGISVLSALSYANGILGGLGASKSRLGASGTGNAALSYILGILLTPVEFFKKLYMFSDIGVPADIEPNLYCSIIAEILVCFFVYIYIGKRKKAAYLAVFMGMVASFFVGALSYVWHAFAVPNGVYHRFTNMFIFLVLFLILYVLQHLQDIRMWQIVFMGIIQLIINVIVFVNIPDYLDFYAYLISALLFVFYYAMLVLFCKGSLTYRQIVLVISIVGLLEVSVNAFSGLQSYDEGYFSQNDTYILECENMAKEVEMNNGERVAVTDRLSNMGAVLNLPSISCFVSSINNEMKTLCSRLGMSENGNVEYVVRGGSPLVNLIFNIRYIFAADDVQTSDADMIQQGNEVNMYRTKRLAGLGYMVNSDIVRWDIYNDPCFDVQNSFVKYATGEDAIFENVEPDVKCVDIGGNEIENEKEYKEKYGSYVYMRKSKYGNVYDTVQAEFVVDHDMDLYVYSYTQYISRTTILVDDQIKLVEPKSYVQSTYHVGNVKKGQKITIASRVDMDVDIDSTMTWLLRFASFNEDVYAKAYKKLSDNVYNVDVMKSDYVKGTIQADEDGIMMTSIQSGSAFRVYVDDEQVECETIGGVFIGVPLKQGSHVVEFRYEPSRKQWSIWVARAAFSVYIILCIISIVGNNRKNNK